MKRTTRWLLLFLLAFTAALAQEPKIGQLDLTAAPAADAYRLIGKMCGLNVVVDDSVQGQITVSLRDLPLRQALDSLTAARGDAYRLEGNLLLIASRQKLGAGGEELRVRFFPLSHGDPAEVAKAVGLLLGKEQVVYLEKNKQLVARGSDVQLDLAAGLIAKLDEAPAQIDFVVRLEEVSRTGMEELGMSWKFSLQSEPGGRVGLGYESLLDALEEKGQATVLERVTVTALEGRAASTMIGERTPLVVEDVVQGNVSRQLMYIDAGVKLKLLPELESNGKITVTVEPEVSSVAGWTPQNYPRIKTRQSSTTLQIADGQTAVLSGLVEKKELESWTSVPVLGKIPILGRLFQKKQLDTAESEILILITPKLRTEEEDIL